MLETLGIGDIAGGRGPVRFWWMAVVASCLAGLSVAGSAAAEGRGFIVVASTTSTENSGLFDAIVPRFESATGIGVRVVAVGTGQALRLGCNGDVDAVLVHAPAAEREFIEAGCGVDRRPVMVNDFVIIGPADDPAQVADADSAFSAFGLIAEGGAPFTSRGDNSGTHKKEREIWASLGVDPSGPWYRELGSGMGATLNTAAVMNAYLLADRGTWISFGNRRQLNLLYEDDTVLLNPYSSILVNPERYPVRHQLAVQWHEWLTSDAGQAVIGEYRLRGQVLFRPVHRARP